MPQVLATSDGTKNLYGLDRIGVEQGGAWRYPLPDALGSVRQWTDPAGGVLAAQSYGPFGETRDPVGTPPWGFTGEWQDPAGMVYLRARWYNPALGRFTQVDPVAGLLAAPATLHPYAYVLNDPLNDTDPSGEIAPWVLAVGIGAGIGAVAAGVRYVRSNPGGSLGDYVNDRHFWSAVGVGAASGAVSGLVGYLVPGLFPAAHSLVGAVGLGAITGAATSATGQLVENLLTPCRKWNEGVAEAALSGGITGGLAAGAGYAARVVFGKADVTVRRLRKGVSLRSDEGRVEVHVLEGKDVKNVPDWTKGKLLPHWHRAVEDVGGQVVEGQGLGRHRPWQWSPVDTSFWDRF